jgi:hypothetical protein
LTSSGTDILCGFHLPRCSYYILYFLWLYNELFIILYNILNNCWVRLLSCPTGCQSYLLYNVNNKWYIYVWKLNQTVLELDFRAVKFCSSLDGIWVHIIDTLQHQSLGLMFSDPVHPTTSTPWKWASIVEVLPCLLRKI